MSAAYSSLSIQRMSTSCSNTQ